MNILEIIKTITEFFKVIKNFFLQLEKKNLIALILLFVFIYYWIYKLYYNYKNIVVWIFVKLLLLILVVIVIVLLYYGIKKIREKYYNWKYVIGIDWDYWQLLTLSLIREVEKYTKIKSSIVELDSFLPYSSNDDILYYVKKYNIDSFINFSEIDNLKIKLKIICSNNKSSFIYLFDNIIFDKVNIHIYLYLLLYYIHFKSSKIWFKELIKDESLKKEWMNLWKNYIKNYNVYILYSYISLVSLWKDIINKNKKKYQISNYYNNFNSDFWKYLISYNKIFLSMAVNNKKFVLEKISLYIRILYETYFIDYFLFKNNEAKDEFLIVFKKLLKIIKDESIDYLKLFNRILWYWIILEWDKETKFFSKIKELIEKNIWDKNINNNLNTVWIMKSSYMYELSSYSVLFNNIEINKNLKKFIKNKVIINNINWLGEKTLENISVILDYKL